MKMQRAPTCWQAWAIRIDDPDEGREGYAGRYYFGGDIPPWLAGCRTALFDTRAEAREFAERGNRNLRAWSRIRLRVRRVGVGMVDRGR
jgi:hypothetical protein